MFDSSYNGHVPSYAKQLKGGDSVEFARVEIGSITSSDIGSTERDEHGHAHISARVYFASAAKIAREMGLSESEGGHVRVQYNDKVLMRVVLSGPQRLIALWQAAQAVHDRLERGYTFQILG